MRKHYYFLFTLLALLTGFTRAGAQQISPYLVDFNTAISVSSHDFAVSSAWAHLVESVDKNWYGTQNYVVYTYNSAGGVDDSGYLQIGSQKLLDYAGDYVPVKDILITPPVTGTSSIYVKKDGDEGFIDVYKMTVNSKGVWSTSGSAISTTDSKDIEDGWVKIDIPAVEAGTYLGIHAAKVGIDNFEAASALVEEKKSLAIESISGADIPLTIVADDEGNWSFTFSVTIKNNGEATLEPGMEGYSLSILDPVTKEVLCTTDLTEELVAGESMTVNVTANLNLSEHSTAGYYYVQENITNNQKVWYGRKINPKANVPLMSIIGTKESYVYGSGYTFEIGVVKKDISIPLTLWNTGQKTLEVSSISADGDVTVDVETPFSVAVGEKLSLNALISAAEAGVKKGQLKFTTNIGDSTLNFVAKVADETTYYQGFDGAKSLPAGMIGELGWTFGAKPDAFINTADSVTAKCNASNEAKLITPLLQFEEGDEIEFLSSRTTALKTDSLNIYYSADRKEWTLLTTIKNSEWPVVKVGYDYAPKAFAVSGIPAGQYYVAFASKSCVLDNIYGGKQVEVAHDLVVNSITVPKSSVVNNSVTITTELHNVHANTEPADSYTATLYVDGVAVDTAAGVELANGEDATFTFSYVPHKDGDHTVYVEFAAGDYKVKSDEVTLNAKAESSNKVFTTGTASTTDFKVPVNTYYNNSESVLLYTPSKLSGLKKGDKISKIVFKGCVTPSYFGTDYVSTLQVWLANSEETELADPEKNFDTEGLDQIYNQETTWLVKGENVLSKLEDVMVFEFDEPFVYEGGSIKMMFKNASTSYRKIYFEMEEANDNLAYYRYSDSALENTDFKSSALPIAQIYIESELKQLTGTVTDKSGNAIAGADITLKSGDVEYYGTTADDGTYAVGVVQDELAYEATYSAAGYIDNTMSVSLDGTAADAQLSLGTRSVEAGKPIAVVLPMNLDAATVATYGKFYELGSYADGVATFNISDGVQAYKPYIFVPAQTMTLPLNSFDEALNAAYLQPTTVDGVTFSGLLNRQHIASTEASKVYTFNGTEFALVETDAYNLPLDAVLTLTDGDAKTITIQLVDVPTGISEIGIDSAAAGNVYTTSGVLVGTKGVKGLKPGLYIVGGKKVVVK